jgi:hypothetical protein
MAQHEHGAALMDDRKPHKGPREKKIDRSVDMTFPASDAPVHGRATGTETPARPTDRKAPKITKEEIERAKRGAGHKQ